MKFTDTPRDGNPQDNTTEPVKQLHACLDMVSCYASMMSTLRQSPDFPRTLDLIQLMESLKDLLVDECYELQRILDEQVRPEMDREK